MNSESIGRLSIGEMERIYEEVGKTLKKYEYGLPNAFVTRVQAKKLEQ